MSERTVAELRADNLRKLDRDIHAAQTTVNELYTAHVEASRELQRLRACRRREALWAKAQELRDELARVEAEAANITLSGDVGRDPMADK